MRSLHHNMTHLIPLLVFTYLLSIEWTKGDPSCPIKLNNCTHMVRPYLNDLRYMFPTNLQDVTEMCRMWSQFVDCVRRYVSSCFSEERRMLFHKSVENSVDTVHAICSSDVYQREYLSHAACFKRVSIDNCGDFYKQLIDHVSNPRAHDDHICCSYGQFKNCVNDPLLRECGRRARSLMDHSMGFLISRCGDKTQNSYAQRCPDPEPTVYPTTTEEPYISNDISNRARADRSFSPDLTTTLSPSPRTVVYTLPPEPGSRTSYSITIEANIFLILYSLILCLL